MHRTLALLLCLLAAPPALRAQSITGQLVEDGSGAPLAGGIMTLLGPDSIALARVQTDSAGAFAFALPGRGSYRLRAQRAGFRAATSPALSVGARDTLEVEFSLGREVVVLEPLVVRARSRRLTSAARRFYDRAERGGFGTFITRAEVERSHAFSTTELFRRIPGVSLSPMMGGNAVTVRGTCRPSLYIDGVRVEGYRSVDDLVQPGEVEGIEVYRSTSDAPVEYTGLRAGCAVILVWTRIE